MASFDELKTAEDVQAKLKSLLQSTHNLTFSAVMLVEEACADERIAGITPDDIKSIALKIEDYDAGSLLRLASAVRDHAHLANALPFAPFSKAFEYAIEAEPKYVSRLVKGIGEYPVLVAQMDAYQLRDILKSLVISFDKSDSEKKKAIIDDVHPFVEAILSGKPDQADALKSSALVSWLLVYDDKMDRVVSFFENHPDAVMDMRRENLMNCIRGVNLPDEADILFRMMNWIRTHTNSESQEYLLPRAASYALGSIFFREGDVTDESMTLYNRLQDWAEGQPQLQAAIKETGIFVAPSRTDIPNASHAFLNVAEKRRYRGRRKSDPKKVTGGIKMHFADKVALRPSDVVHAHAVEIRNGGAGNQTYERVALTLDFLEQAANTPELGPVLQPIAQRELRRTERQWRRLGDQLALKHD